MSVRVTRPTRPARRGARAPPIVVRASANQAAIRPRQPSSDPVPHRARLRSRRAISSTTSSMVVSPSMPPNSSITRRHVDARQPHLQQQIERTHRRRDEQHLAQDRFQIERAIARETGEHVLDVDHADHVIKRLAIDRQSRVALRAHGRHERRELDIDEHTGNIGARHHHVVSGQVAQPQRYCGRSVLSSSVIGASTSVSRLLDQLFDGLAQRVAVAAAAQGSEPVLRDLAAVTIRRRPRCAMVQGWRRLVHWGRSDADAARRPARTA